MISLIVLSHSPAIARGVRELALEMGGEMPVYAVGGTNSGALGADFNAMLEAFRQAATLSDAIVLSDMGSTRMTSQRAFEALSPELRARVHMSDAALVEGAMVAALAIGAGLPLESVVEQLEEFNLNK